MKYVLRRITDGQFKSAANKRSNSPRWTLEINEARVYKRRCDVTQSREQYPANLIEAVPVKLVEIKL